MQIRHLLGLITLVAVTSMVSASATAWLTRPQSATAEPPVYRARGFEVYDDAGMMRAALYVDGTGVRLSFLDADGRRHLTLGQVEDRRAESIVLGVLDHREQVRIAFGLTPAGPTIFMTDAHGAPIWSAP